MQEKNSEPFLYQEEEIDFTSLILTLLASKGLIIGLTLAFTALIAIYNFIQTPVYQATATVMLGNYATPQVDCRDELWFKAACKKTNSPNDFLYSAEGLIVELNMQVLKNIKNSVSISTNDNNYSLSIASKATSNEIAKNSISEIISYTQKKHLEAFESIKNSRTKRIKSFNDNIKKIEKFELKPLNTKLTQELKIISRKIDYVNNKQLPMLNEQIDLLENKRLPALEVQLINLNMIIDNIINLQVQYIKDNKLPEILEKINLFSLNLAENKKLLAQSLDNLQNLENSSTTLAALRLTKIQDLKENIFNTSEKILDLKLLKSELVLELSGITETKNIIQEYKNIGMLENTGTFVSERLIKIPYFENIIYEYKINLRAIEEMILSIQSSQLPTLKEKRANLILKLEELENEKFFFINYTVPEYELEKDLSTTKISNINLQKNDYESLLANNNYINATLVGEIITSESPFKPKIRRNIIIAFLIGLMSAIFIVLVINLSKATLNKQTG